ncbi:MULTISPECIES: hypothetical protein [unclassified Lysobacter]|uniref:hypothetical protein n=1 Tax=unclassified Lysobacter TaxID=2635362 RepID=UPI001BE818A0|nr:MULTISPECIES: hypothetical protein [unclassified Lysobacter]MBT2748377.1 hypothetical protein [Lysobacter sp. ISL-42]MBT2749856.1 hypothetical protein [Lysobacter sp. ISL-50]MBT2781184.1 hypothetical protein [Lysobacter sp. ISL-52]
MMLLEHCISRPASELADYPPEVLFDLKKQAADGLATAKANAELVDRALDLRYSRTAASARIAAGKDTGSVTFADGAIRVSVELPKKIEWDQTKLARIVERIRAAGEDPTEFVEVSYRISESKYSAWPASMRSPFDAARTLKIGKPTFRLSLPVGAA